MKAFKKIPIVFLMLLSQLLLTFFVLYWLIGQYRMEKFTLQRELSRGFDTAERSMIDSLMSIHLINPILGDSSNFTIQLDLRSDSADRNSFDTLVTIADPHSIERHRGNVEIKSLNIVKDSMTKEKKPVFHIVPSGDTTNAYLYQGVRMFVNRMEGMGNYRSGRTSFFGSKADTLILQDNFKKFLQQNEFDFSLTWISSKEVIKPSHEGITISSRIFNNSFAVKLEGFNSYLLFAMGPQLFFALILLIITAGSFRLSYLNIKKQKKLLLIKNEFISNITHELKTPVSTVKVALEALLDFDMSKDPEVVKDYLEMSLLEMNRLDLLVSKVLNNSVLENGENLFETEDTDINSLIEEVIKSLQYRLSKNNASLNFSTVLSEAIAKVDSIHLQGVIINLIDNSLKYCKAPAIISLNLCRKAGYFEISVKDNGPGIPEEYLKRVFDKFFRVPTHNKHNVKGYGLGLNYAKLVMEHHKGSINVFNRTEGGCEFILKVPTGDEKA
ncbi:MAG: HAMP domain-containing histidine kinase [Bacteroidetes bacterium]|nr:HAMP domain-containing histidine kinase [Bacteroidota bacterium]